MSESYYDKTTSRNEQINGIGFDYKGKILRRTVSPYLFEDPKRAAILDWFEDWIFFLVEKVKLVRTYYMYAVPKNYKKLN